MKYIIFLFYLALSVSVYGTQYYVRPDGNNSNTGTADTSGGAWLTIQKAASTMVAGDSVSIAAGTYNENVATGAAGTAMSPISFTASGAVNVFGWTFNHAYNTVTGIFIKDNASSDVGGAIEFSDNGDNCIFENGGISDGMWIRNTDLAFVDSNPDTITSVTGGFLTAGIRAGVSIRIFDSESTTDISTGNKGTFLLSNVTENTLTFDAGVSLVPETGKKAFIYGSRNAVQFRSGSANGILRNCTFSNTGSRWIAINGDGHLIENNFFINADGFDGILYGGTNITIRRNVIADSYDQMATTVKYWSPSPDMLSIQSAIANASNILIEENIIMNCIGAAGFDHGAMFGPITFRKNVFYNVGHGYLVWQNNMTYDRNTFYRVAEAGTIVAQSASHPIYWSHGTYNPTAATVTGNIFVSCGNGTGPSVGWYTTAAEPQLVLTADYNFVAGSAPVYGSKIGFSEANGINGGDPKFVDPNDPLGPDNLPFTDDDGLRLSVGSPAIGANVGGTDIGAYDYFVGTPGSETINATNVNASTTTVGQ